mmetsp:Transcript_15327/g.25901  ORF Transcript_15327/g.25901 Transcript_15327/m.25901 type:complete len:124 (-) Transcript_15327:978-1349(-)
MQFEEQTNAFNPNQFLRRESHSVGKLQSLSAMVGVFRAQSAFEDEFGSFGRPQFRVQFKGWRQSNFGDFIEYQITVQSLEGNRGTWNISKRYTEFVRLHEALTPFFRIQLQRKSLRSQTRGQS